MIKKDLLAMQDLKYRDFHAKLMPTICKEKIIGIRVPLLRKYAKTLFQEQCRNAFMNTLPHTYYEENNIHAFLIEQINDFDACIAETERFLPYIDNWATCDMMRPKVFKKHTDELFRYIQKWLQSNHVYTVRYAIGILHAFYLTDHFSPEHLALVSEIKSDEYYINMMIAWYFATALALQYEHTLPYLTNQKLSDWVHNKTIQKAIESYRIPPETKVNLKKLKIK